jgi:hypothetical protein
MAEANPTQRAEIDGQNNIVVQIEGDRNSKGRMAIPGGNAESRRQ